MPLFFLRFRLPLLLLAAAMALALPGCGLADYEERLRHEQARVKAVEEERKYLADPLEMPASREGDAGVPALQQANVFLRPPRLFAAKLLPDGPVAVGKRVQLFAYPGADNARILLAALPDSKDNSDYEFDQDVWSAFQDYLGIRLPKQHLPALKKEERQPPRIAKEPSPPLKFESCVWDEPETGKTPLPYRYLCYFHRGGNVRLAIIYQLPLPRAADPAYKAGIDASLKSLALGPDAVARRLLYNKETRAAGR